MQYYWNSVFLLWLSYIISFTYAGTATADDTDAGMFYSGLWVPDGDPNTFGHHDTWTNQSGASVTFNFIGVLDVLLLLRISHPNGKVLRLRSSPRDVLKDNT